MDDAGLPPSPTVDDLVRYVKERGIRTIALMHVGGDGWLKTLDFVPHSVEQARDVLLGGERADGSSLFKGTGIRTEASDIVLRPRPETAFLDPFSPRPTLCVLCHHLGRDGEPLPESPDTIVRKAYANLRRDTGAELHALGEIEYFLGRRAEEEDIYGDADRGYHATAPFVFGEKLRREAMEILAGIGVRLKYGHSEVGYVEATEADGVIWEQHEIELQLAPLPEAADAIVLTQWVLRNLAHHRELRCSFSPIVREGHAGSGLHVHFAVLRDGVNVSAPRPDGSLEPEARWLVGGLARCSGALMAFGNREPASFVRLTQGKEAPGTVTWGPFNRHALIRLPIQARSADGRTTTPATIELRLADGSATPHLLLAGVAQAVRHGKGMAELDAFLAHTRIGGPEHDPSAALPVPRDFLAVARELERLRPVMEADGVFPPALLQGVLHRLRA